MSRKRHKTDDDLKVKTLKKVARETFKGMPRSKYHKVKDRRPSRKEKTRDMLEQYLEEEDG